MTVKQLPRVQPRQSWPPGNSKMRNFAGFLVGIRTLFSERPVRDFSPVRRWHATCHFTDLILFPRDQVVRAVLKEDMGRGFTVFGRFLRRKTLCYYLGSAMVL